MNGGQHRGWRIRRARIAHLRDVRGIEEHDDVGAANRRERSRVNPAAHAPFALARRDRGFGDDVGNAERAAHAGPTPSGALWCR